MQIHLLLIMALITALLLTSISWANYWPPNTEITYATKIRNLQTGYQRSASLQKKILAFDPVQKKYQIHLLEKWFDGIDHEKESQYWQSYPGPTETQARIQNCEKEGGKLEYIELAIGRTLSCHYLTTNCEGIYCTLNTWYADIAFGLAKWTIDIVDGDSHFLGRGEITANNVPKDSDR